MSSCRFQCSLCASFYEKGTGTHHFHHFHPNLGDTLRSYTHISHNYWWNFFPSRSEWRFKKKKIHSWSSITEMSNERAMKPWQQNQCAVPSPQPPQPGLHWEFQRKLLSQSSSPCRGQEGRLFYFVLLLSWTIFFPQNIILAQPLLHPRLRAASGTPEEHFSWKPTATQRMGYNLSYGKLPGKITMETKLTDKCLFCYCQFLPTFERN